MLSEKWHRYTCRKRGCPRPSICKTRRYLRSAIKQHARKGATPVFQSTFSCKQKCDQGCNGALCILQRSKPWAGSRSAARFHIVAASAAGLWCGFGQASPAFYEGCGGSLPRTLRDLMFSSPGGEGACTCAEPRLHSGARGLRSKGRVWWVLTGFSPALASPWTPIPATLLPAS